MYDGKFGAFMFFHFLSNITFDPCGHGIGENLLCVGNLCEIGNPLVFEIEASH